MKTIRIVLAFAACMSLAAHAANGVVEINHARALVGGVTTGDGAGYPVNINASGSYILTSNLAATSGGIVVTVSNVTIDLNGFAISGTGTGINVTSGSNVVVKNGTIVSMSSSGVVLLTNSRVENVRAISNGSDGIIVGDGSVVVNSLASANTGRGINATAKTVLKDNVSLGNAGDATGGIKTFLLFPYVSNANSADTTFTISNTTTDPTNLGSTNLAGTCTVTYYRGNSGVATAGVTFNVPTGQQISWPMSAGGSGAPAIPLGYTGYLIAECNFPMAHGVAILKDATSSTTLPAYVIRPQRLGNQPEGLGN